MKLANYSRLTSKLACQSIEDCRLYYDRREKSNPIPPSLEEYAQGTHTLYLRQVPSASTLRKASGKLVPSHLARMVGVKLPELWNSLEQKNRTPSPYTEEEGSEEDSFEEWDSPLPLTGAKYKDPWKIMAAYAFTEQYSSVKPEILVWSGGHRRITDRVPQRLFGSDRKGSTNFTSVADVDERLYFIRVHTHWGHALGECRIGRSRIVEAGFAKNLWRRICRFLRGHSDPIWTGEEKGRFWKDQKPRKPAARAIRLLEVLKTVDGLFLQRYLSFPEEVWTWDKYDAFVLQALSYLLTDEFLDGSVNADAMDQVTFYEEVKGARKQAKLAFHTKLEAQYRNLDSLPRWVQSFLRPTWRLAQRMSGTQYVELAGIVSQTRGCGTPPATVLLKSKRKFLLGIQQEPIKLETGQRQLLLRAMNGLISSIPSHIFSGLTTKARVTVTGSACAEATRREGGTAQAILDLLEKIREFGVSVRDLQTGETVGSKSLDSFDSIGTAIFFACVDEIMWTEPQDLRQCFLTMVKEPGKARVVTKGHAALKVVLDTVSRICSWPLKKAIKSSESGMGRAHHGWNLFVDLFNEEESDMLFSVAERDIEELDDHVIQSEVYKDLYFSSTDYQEATDAMQHEVASLIAERWMRLCGIPDLLRGIVHGVCYQPREIFFSGTGPLAEIGEYDEDKGLRKVTLRTGVLMGDPLTKPVLHLVNILVRRIPQMLEDGTLLQNSTNFAEAQEAVKGMFPGP
nr:TPA_asm: RNA-dependent RNA polymerase [Narnavirus sp.]